MPARPTSPRAERRFKLAFWITVCGLLAALVYQFAIGAIGINYEANWVYGILVMIVGGVLCYKHFRRRIIRKFLLPHAGSICPRCHYPLRKLPDVGTCPECGTKYTRAQVVDLWERFYGLRRTYARSGEGSAANAQLTVRSVGAVSPWSTWSFREAITRLESLTRKRGYSAPRLPVYALELDPFVERLGRPLPGDLYSFLGWFDRTFWMHVLRPESNTQQSTEGGWGDEAKEFIRIRTPSELRVYTLAEGMKERADVRLFGESLAGNGRAAAWLETQMIEFADTRSGMVVVYCTDPPDMHRGAIVTFLPGEPDRVWLADSLSQWLIRIAACDGVDCTLDPSMIETLTPQLREFYRAEFAEKNPNSRLHLSSESASAAVALGHTTA